MSSRPAPSTFLFTDIEGSTRLLLRYRDKTGLTNASRVSYVVAINDAPDRRADRRALGHKGRFPA